MEIIRIPKIMQDTVSGLLLCGKTIGFVPTMGALHEGHLSLVKRARQENDKTVVSIFVNPLQFGPDEDFPRYPRDVEGDTEKLAKEAADILFIPDAPLMYPEGFLTRIEVGKISDKLCGFFRPGHFIGVATVVAKLFHIVKPTRSYFGQKDFQQAVIIGKMVRDLNMDIDVVICPTIREKDGLAMSSRNAYLTQAERKVSGVLYRSLKETADLLTSGIINSIHLKEMMHEKILQEPAVSSIDYAGFYDPETLKELSMIQGDVLLAVAAKIGNTRLIDNILVTMRKER
ncbi:MAG: pantoate--beta-alanine ligase [Thermodesulfovibrionales bacterium]|nr:pantoate--beta-alanine ligase [Thermodesulfovibrionales bacterium]